MNQCITENDEKKFTNIFLKANRAMPEKLVTKPWFEKGTDDYWRLYFYSKTKRYQQFLAIAASYYDREYLSMSRDAVLEKDSVILARAISIFGDTGFYKTPAAPGLIEMTKEAFKKYYSSRLVSELNLAGEIVLFNAKTELMFLKALKWLQKSSEIEQTPENMYIQGLLYYRLGKTKEAIEWLENAATGVTDEKLRIKISLALEAVKKRKSFESFVNSDKI